MSLTQQDYILGIEKVSKSFSGVKALDEVSLYIKPGEVHALMGENGAGKSTLMKIVTGIYQKDEGEIFIDGERAIIKDPKAALDLGISMIHQELNQIVDMTVAENIFLGKEPCHGRSHVINRRKQKELVRSLLHHIGISINPNARIGDLSIAERQMVEIVKAVSYNSRIIIMDEPTSAITDKEVAKLFGIIRNLTSKGVAIIYISHKMDEIFEIADTVTVLRDGCYVDSKPVNEFNNNSLIRLMVGRNINDLFLKEAVNVGKPALEVNSLTKKGFFQNISFKVCQGEVVGFAGLMGAGRTEVMETLFGIMRHDNGMVKINNKEVVINSPTDAVKHGMALISEDRKLKGLNLKGSVKANITLSNLADCCNIWEVIDRKKENQIVDEQIKLLNIKASGRNQLVSTLSGGNQQKVVLSKWFLTNPEILILDEPTRGIDIGAKQEVYKIIARLAQQGKAIILISSEMPELLGLCDRIIVLHKGNITGNFSRANFNSEVIMGAAMGQHQD
ncbi:MAG TPA: sugar ABC transporter ATP-binding protein [Segetibacter sp.]|nr:sugar ABC transporter ATP-binding protein [Segetibacter sp.]